jgi:hypothetical protein
VSTHYFRFTSRGAADPQRSRLLERLLARADAASEVTDWRADAFRVLAPQLTCMPGVGAAALVAQRGSVDGASVDGASVFVATPVHYVAEMSNVRLPADGILSLRQSEAEALAIDFNRVWSDAGIRLLSGTCADLFCVLDQPLTATTYDPEDVIDRHIENHLPTGAAAPRLRQLMSEIEMWLFEHAVNRTRTADAAAAVNGLWLWGGGLGLAALPAVSGWTAGDDIFFKAFTGAPVSADAPAPVRADASSGVAVIAAQPGTAEWHDVESRWLESSLADLRSGRIARIDLSAGSRCFSVGPHWRRRFWRRSRPWWESFE